MTMLVLVTPIVVPVTLTVPTTVRASTAAAFARRHAAVDTRRSRGQFTGEFAVGVDDGSGLHAGVNEQTQQNVPGKQTVFDAHARARARARARSVKIDFITRGRVRVVGVSLFAFRVFRCSPTGRVSSTDQKCLCTFNGMSLMTSESRTTSNLELLYGRAVKCAYVTRATVTHAESNIRYKRSI
jgi:hypothetical protein